MTNREYYIAQAQLRAKRDFERGLIADSTRHGGRKYSAWSKAYNEHYEYLQLNKC